MSNNYFIIHGSYGNPYKNWIPWLKKQLSKRKMEKQISNSPEILGRKLGCYLSVLQLFRASKKDNVYDEHD